MQSTSNKVVINGNDLTVEDVVRVARGRARVEISREALQRVRRARDVVDQVLERGDVVYGLNTGVGSLARYRVPLENLEQFSMRMVLGHIARHGEEQDTEVVRAMMLTRSNGMVKGGVGVRAEVIQAFVDALNAGVHPIVRMGGSVGQSDLAEMADIGQTLMGFGEAEYRGSRMPGGEALEAAGLQPIRLKAKEGLGLISANGITVGNGSLVLAQVAELLDAFDISAALALEGFVANLTIIHPEAARMRPHPGQRRAADRLRELLDGSYLWKAGAARNLQDPLSFRCIPQTHGSGYDGHAHARRIMEVELNSSSDNPLVILDDQSIISTGNFDVVSLSVAFDHLRIALAQMMHIANERVQKQLWSQFSGLLTGLAAEEGPEGGLRPLGRTCAALTAEARSLANPTSLDYRGQLAEGIEDHASLAPLGVRKTEELARVAWQLVTVELVVAARAVDLRGHPDLGSGTRVVYEAVREFASESLEEQWPDIDSLAKFVSSGKLSERVAAEVGSRHPITNGSDGVVPDT